MQSKTQENLLFSAVYEPLGSKELNFWKITPFLSLAIVLRLFVINKHLYPVGRAIT